MALTLITGRANAGKTGQLYDLLEQTVRTGERAVLLLPAHPEVGRAVVEFARRGTVGLRIVTFEGWLAELWDGYGDGRRLLTNSARYSAVEEVLALSKHRPDEETGDTAGFSRLVAEVARRASGFETNPDTRTARMLAGVLADYDTVLRNKHLIEPGEAAALIASEPPTNVELVVANRFSDLSVTQERLLTAFSKRCDVRVALPWEKDFPATEALDSLVDRLSVQATHVSVESSAPESELSLVEEGLYRPESHRAISQGQLVMAEASGEEAEQALVADLVAEARDEGIQLGRIAVVFREASQRAHALSLQLAQRGIDAEVDVAVPFQTAGLGRAFLAVLDVCSGRQLTRERMLDFLNSPYSGIDTTTLSKLDTSWRQNRTEGQRLISDVVRTNASPASVLDRARVLCKSDFSTQTAIALQRVVGALLAEAQRSQGGPGDRVLDAAAHRAILSTLGELMEAKGDCVGVRDLYDALKRRRIASGQSDREDAVQLTEVERIRSRRFDFVVLGGLTADEFSSDRPTGPLDGRLEELGLPSEQNSRLSERLLFYLVASRARSRLVLVRQTSGSEGEAKRASAFWDDVRELYGEVPGDKESPQVIPRRSRSLADVAVSAPAYSPLRQETRSTLRSRTSATEALQDDDVLAALANEKEFSVTELETYTACPRRWFHERTISPREIDVSFDARARGSLAHRVLADFYGRWRGEVGRGRVSPESLEEALGLAEQTMTASEKVKAVGLAEQLAVAETREWVRNAIEADAFLLPGFEPVAHEAGFGEREDRPVEIGQDTFIRGRIDRIDRRGKQVVVTDYKSREIKGYGSFESAGLIQIPLYAYVVAQLPETEVVAGVYRSLAQNSLRGFWDGDKLDLCAQGSDRDRVFDSDIQEIVNVALAAAGEAAAGIRAGEISARPSIASACQYCALARTCEGAR